MGWRTEIELVSKKVKMIEIIRKSGDEILRVGVVLIMLLMTVMPVEIRWMECEMWMFNGIPVLLLLGFTMMMWQKQRLHFTTVDAIVFIWFFYYVGRAWIGNEWPCRMELLKTVELWLLYVALRISFNGTKISAWVLVGVILAFGCYEAYLGVSQMYGSNQSRHLLYALTGNFLNPGPYSAYLMIGVVVGMVALKETSEKAIITAMPKFIPVKVADLLKEITWRHVIITTVVFMAILLPATMSRAAYVGLAVFVLLFYRDKYWKYRYVVWGCILITGIAGYFMKQGSADGRMVIWKASLTTWMHYPFLGVGVGGFLHAFSDGMNELTARGKALTSGGVPDWAYNSFVKIVVEQGIVGGILAISFTASVLAKLARNSSSLFWGIVALLVFSMFSYPFDLLPYKVIAVLVVAWSESVGGKNLFEIGRMKMLLVSCFLGFVSWQTGKIAYKSLELAWDYGNGYYKYTLNDFARLKDNANDNYEFLFAYGKMLREEGQYNESNAILMQGTMCSADPMFYVLMGNNYKDMKHYELAEQAYHKAFAVMPNRIYPLYQLMLLYSESGDKQKERAMARRVIDMKPKIESPATRDMKKRAINIMHDKRGSRKSLTE